MNLCVNADKCKACVSVYVAVWEDTAAIAAAADSQNFIFHHKPQDFVTENQTTTLTTITITITTSIEMKRSVCCLVFVIRIQYNLFVRFCSVVRSLYPLSVCLFVCLYICSIFG